MTLITLGSVAGSPGVTRLAVGLAAAWPEPARRRVLLEADPDGGRLGAELGVGVEPGLIAVALASRTPGLTAGEAVERGAVAVGDWFVMPAPPSSEQTASVLVHAGTALARLVASDPDSVWIVDAGRLSTRSPALPFAKDADHVVLVSAGGFPALQLLPHRVEALRSADCDVSVVVVEPTSWPVDEIAEFVGADVAAVVPHVKDSRPAGLATMRGNAWRAWWRRVEDLASYLAFATARAQEVSVP